VEEFMEREECKKMKEELEYFYAAELKGEGER
jgi:hypothetical protein